MEFAKNGVVLKLVGLLCLASVSRACSGCNGDTHSLDSHVPTICFESDVQIEFRNMSSEHSNSTHPERIVVDSSVRIEGDEYCEFRFSAYRQVRPVISLPVQPEVEVPCGEERPKECTKSWLKMGPFGMCDLTEQVSLQCGGSSSAKKIVMQGSVSLPTAAPCQYIIQRFSKDVCQLRVDFDTYLPQPNDIAPNAIPGSMGHCGTNYISIGGMSFCGVNSKQHVYLPLGKSSNAETISVQVAGNNNANWRITVTQLECPPPDNEESKQLTHTLPGQLLDVHKLIQKKTYDQELIAPNGCLQYFPNSTGVFESFNYNGGAGPYMPNMKYAICFNRHPMASSIQFSAERFNMSFNDNGLVDVPMTDGECIDEQGDTQVYANDHLLIPYSTIVQTGEQATRFCGSILEGQNLIATPPGPFEVIVNTGNLYYPPNFGPKPPRAFRLSYSII